MLGYDKPDERAVELSDFENFESSMRNRPRKETRLRRHTGSGRGRTDHRIDVEYRPLQAEHSKHRLPVGGKIFGPPSSSSS